MSFSRKSPRHGGLVYFFVLFIAVLVYALWPSRQKQFDESARMPLRED
jgi:cytochrome c oxidase cbb3-type subunit 4